MKQRKSENLFPVQKLTPGRESVNTDNSWTGSIKTKNNRGLTTALQIPRPAGNQRQRKLTAECHSGGLKAIKNVDAHFEQRQANSKHALLFRHRQYLAATEEGRPRNKFYLYIPKKKKKKKNSHVQNYVTLDIIFVYEILLFEDLLY
jgi:hypothetical protein